MPSLASARLFCVLLVVSVAGCDEGTLDSVDPGGFSPGGDASLTPLDGGGTGVDGAVPSDGGESDGSTSETPDGSSGEDASATPDGGETPAPEDGGQAPEPDGSEPWACAMGWVMQGDGCVPECLPLPESFETVATPPADPIFGNTVWFDPDIITPSDPSSFVDLTYAGTGSRSMFDRRTASFDTHVAHLFDAQFGTSTFVEIQVNPEFSQQEAETEARRHALVIGQLPAFLFAELETVWIHKGVELFGGGNNNLLIHTGQTDNYIADGVLEETFIHEATHTSIDPHHADDANWLAAQAADGVAISPYARDFPNREDLAETMAPYLAARFRPARLDVGVPERLLTSLANRAKYLDCLQLSMDPPQ